MSKDYQKSKVYAWENRFASGRHLPFEGIAAYVRMVWEGEGLIGPPLVEQLAPQNRKHLAKGSRGHVWFPKTGTDEKTILHELAHSMTGTVHGHCDAHGPDFVGLYIYLLDKYLKVPSTMCWFLAQKEKIEFNMFAKPWCGK